MSLFKKNIVTNYNVISDKNDTLLMHCSRTDMVKAPIGGKVKVEDNRVVITKNKFKIIIGHINVKDSLGDYVKAGDVLGHPLLGKVKGSNIAFVSLDVLKDGEKQSPTLYTTRKDNDDIVETPKKKKNAPKKEIESAEIAPEFDFESAFNDEIKEEEM